MLELEIPEAMEVLAYIAEADMREKMFQRWIGSVYSPQCEMSLDEFIGTHSGAATVRSSAEIIAKMDRIMEGRCVDGNL